MRGTERLQSGDEMVYCGTLIVSVCCTCEMSFAMPSDFHRRALDDHRRWFFCPAGHQQHYTGPTPLELEKRARANAEEQARIARAEHVRVEMELRRQARRQAGGVCPCCNRSFPALAEHIEGQHPDYAAGHRNQDGKVQCACCEKWVSPRKDGAVRRHQTYGYHGDECCPGSGESPL